MTSFERSLAQRRDALVKANVIRVYRKELKQAVAAGRVDVDAILVGGDERVATMKAEELLLAIPGVAEAAALPVPDDLRGEEVKAYVVLADGRTQADLPPERIIELCRRRLAAFKVPRLIEYRRAPLPRSTSGKVRKPDLVAEKADLRQGCWDRVAGGWV